MKNNSHSYQHVDFAGYVNGRLTVIQKSGDGISRWICKCSCGTEVVLTPYYFMHNKSCGCLEKENKENLRTKNITHGKTNTRLYHVWTGIKDRCYNQNAKQFKWYGGRVIKMCDEWKASFDAFKRWAYFFGYDDSKDGNSQSIDRIDVDGDYCPENCRWVTHKEQMRNNTRNIIIKDGDNYVPVCAFCEKYNITYHSFVTRRLKHDILPSQIVREWNYLKGRHPGYYTLDEASTIYNAGTQSIRAWIKKGWIIGEKVGAHYYIPVGQLRPIQSAIKS